MSVLSSDTTPPIVTLTTTPLHYSNQASGAIAFSSNESATFQCSLDGGAYATCSSPFSYNALTNGQHTLSIKATDGAGNVSAPANNTWTVNTALAASSAMLLPQTGQASCYDTVGTVIACINTGQDGDTLMGAAWPSPRFADNSIATPADLTITDHLTGLIWTKDANLMKTRDPSFDVYSTVNDGAVTWQQALDYVNKLNAESYLGHNEWRLPNRNELESLRNRQVAGQAIWLNNSAQGFNNVQGSFYWTGSTNAYSINSAWDSYMSDGHMDSLNKSYFNGGYVWPVRTEQLGTLTLPKTGQVACYDTSGTSRMCGNTGEDGELQVGIAWPSYRFTDNSIVTPADLTVNDNLTGLIWTKNANIAGGTKTWQEALDYIKTLNNGSGYLGHTDWRLPNLNELESLVNKQEANQATWLNNSTPGFNNVQSNIYWSGTTNTVYTYNAWVVVMDDGLVGDYYKALNGYVWPVRGGIVSPVTDLNLISHWKLDGNAIDNSGNGNNGTVYGAVPTSDRFGNANSAMSFNGVNNYITVPDSASLKPNQITMSAWIKPAQLSGYMDIVSKYYANGYYLRILDSSLYSARIDFFAAGDSNATGTEVPANIWSHVVSTYDGTYQKVYINGVLKDSKSGMGPAISNVSNPLTIGALTGGGDYFSGAIDDVRVYNRALSQTEVQSLYATGGTPSETTPPTGTITINTGAATTNTTFATLGLSCADTGSGCAQMKFSNDNVNWSSWQPFASTKNWALSPSDGTKSVYVQYLDNAGNPSIVYSALITLDLPISAPMNIEVQNPTVKGQLVVTWTKPTDSDLNHIHIYRSTIAGTLGTLVADNQTGITWTDTDLASQTRYYYTVKAVDNAGNESLNTSQVSNVTLDNTPADVVTSFAAVNAGTGGTINLSWNASTATDLAFYRIYRTTGVVFYDLVHDNIPRTSTSFVDTGLTNGTLYRYSITAVDTSGNESTMTSSHWIVQATPTAPDTTAPGEILCSAVTITDTQKGGELNLSWTKPTDTDFSLTRVYRSTTLGSLGTLVFEGTAATLAQTGLQSGTNYYYAFRAVDSSGNQVSTALTATNQCTAKPTDLVPPLCPTGLTATVNQDNSITLGWVRSASTDINAYRIYGDGGPGAVDFATPLTTVSQNPLPTAPTSYIWQSAILSAGTYLFAIRPEDSTSPPNVQTGCGTVSATIQGTIPTCGVSARIKAPHTGKKLGGNRLTVVAELIGGNETDLANITFQYRLSGIGDWGTIPPTDVVKFPNPDTTKPWFVHWDISNAVNFPNGDYDIRALSNCGTSSDPSPQFITVTIDRTQAESYEDVDGSGQSVKTENVSVNAPSSIVKADTGVTTAVTSLTLPAGSLTADTSVTITETSPATGATYVLAAYDNAGTFRRIDFADGTQQLANGNSAVLEIPYKDDNNDGIVDGTTINVHDLQVCDYHNGTWKCLDSIVSTNTKTVKAKTSTFSLFALLRPPVPLTDGWNMYSIPLVPTNNAASSVFSASVYPAYIQQWDPVQNKYIYVTTVTPGKGYYAKGTGAANLKVSGAETPDAPYSIQLKRGWNMVGNPFRYKVNVAALKINDGTEKPLQTAENEGKVYGTFFYPINGAYQLATVQDSTATLDPWKGYWLLSDIDCTLVVPNTPAQ